MARLGRLLVVCLACLLCAASVAAAGPKRGVKRGVKGKAGRAGADVDSHLVEFEAMEAAACEYHRAMEPLIERLERETPLRVKKLPVGVRRSEEYELYTLVDDDVHCGGLPFFYNRRSHQSICGATTYKNFKAWALGKPCQVHCPPPLEEITGGGANAPPHPRRGVLAKLKNKLEQVKEKGQGQMASRRGAPEKAPEGGQAPAEDAQGEQPAVEEAAGALQ